MTPILTSKWTVWDIERTGCDLERANAHRRKAHRALDRAWPGGDLDLDCGLVYLAAAAAAAAATATRVERSRCERAVLKVGVERVLVANARVAADGVAGPACVANRPLF